MTALPLPPETIPAKPTIVCLCGSTRFGEAFVRAQLEETLAGRIVLTIGCNLRTDAELFGHHDQRTWFFIKNQLDILHRRKIDLADEVLMLNVDGYLGESSRGELAYAMRLGKPVRWLEPDKALRDPWDGWR